MSRRNAAIKRSILPDPKFSSRLLAKFINMIMKDGKKSVAEKIVYGAFDQITKNQNNGNPFSGIMDSITYEYVFAWAKRNGQIKTLRLRPARSQLAELENSPPGVFEYKTLLLY